MESNQVLFEIERDPEEESLGIEFIQPQIE
jgi:hypothetical protein